MAFKDAWKDKKDGQDYIKAEDINSIAQELISVEEDKEKIDHSKLKHLSFEESGHTGFQRELTNEQLANIENVPNRESLLNKITQLSADSTDEQYPSAKAVYNALEKHGDFELIESVTLEENVMSVTPTISGKYKELFVFFKIPNAPTVGGTKGRWMLYTQNQWGTGITHPIYNHGNWFVGEYTSSSWRTAFHIKLFGNICRTDMWLDTASVWDGAYARQINSSTYSGATVPGIELFTDYIDALKIDFTSPDGTANENLRYLPAGTTYELWGVKA